MAKLPWFPFWVDRFHASKWVRRMSAEQVGVYLLLLAEQWDSGAIVDDDEELSYICRVSVGDVRVVLGWCFDLNEDGMWINAALAEIRQTQESKHKRLSEAGKRGGQATRTRIGIGEQATLKPGSSQAQPRLKQSEVEVESDTEVEVERQKEVIDGLSVMLEKYPDAGTALDAMKHRSRQATDATLRMGFLYADGGGMPDPSVKGETLERRCRLVTAALLELAGQGETDWNPRLLAGYLRRIRKQPDSTSEAASVKDGDPQWEATKRAALEAEKRAVSALNVNAKVDDGAPSVNVNIATMPVADTRHDGRKKTKAIIDLLTAKRASK